MDLLRWFLGFLQKTEPVKAEEVDSVSAKVEKALKVKKKKAKKKVAKKPKETPVDFVVPIAVEEIKVDGKVKVKKPRKSKTSVDKPVESVTVEIKDADK